MKVKSRLGRKDIFTESKIPRKPEGQITVKLDNTQVIKPEKPITRKPENQKTRKE